MSFIEVVGGKHLHGDIEIQGSKNAVLPILAACILNKGTARIHHCPMIQDVLYMIKILESIGCRVVWEDHTIVVDATNIDSHVVSAQYVSSMRSSIILLGALLGRVENVTISYPGGCSIGARPIDLHLKALRKMNVNIIEDNDLIYCDTTGVSGSDIYFDFPSVGATENVILAATLSSGTTVIYNAAQEPEIIELCKFLNQMGANIHGSGTSIITIIGVKALHDIEYDLVSDRIVMGTYMVAVAGTGGDLKLVGNCSNQLTALVSTLRSMGCRIGIGDDYLNICMYERPKAVGLLRTKPYPGFPTDMQSQMMAVLSLAKGTSVVIEDIFEARYKSVNELRKMGAHIDTEGKYAMIKGVDALYGSEVISPDLRGGAALVLAGLMAENRTIVQEPKYIIRGYEDICGDLRSVGADIKYVSTDNI